jgi:hypothetical protein
MFSVLPTIMHSQSILSYAVCYANNFRHNWEISFQSILLSIVTAKHPFIVIIIHYKKYINVLYSYLQLLSFTYRMMIPELSENHSRKEDRWLLHQQGLTQQTKNLYTIQFLFIVLINCWTPTMKWTYLSIAGHLCSWAPANVLKHSVSQSHYFLYQTAMCVSYTLEQVFTHDVYVKSDCVRQGEYYGVNYWGEGGRKYSYNHK